MINLVGIMLMMGEGRVGDGYLKLNNSRIMVLLVVLLLCFNTVITFTGIAQVTPKVYVDPALSTGPPGGDFSVGVKVADISSEQSLYAWEFHLRYDPSILSLIHTRYLRSDDHTVNQLTNGSLLTSQSGSVDSKMRSIAAIKITYSTGIRVWKRDVNGVESEITSGTPVCVASQLKGKTGVVTSAPWNCPSTALQPTDAVVVRVYGQFQGEGIWTELDTWITDQLSGQRVDAATWTCYFYLEVYGAATTYGTLWFDNSTCDSRIEVSGISKGSFLSDAAASQGWSTQSIRQVNNTEGTLKINEYIEPKSVDPIYPPEGAVGSGTLATVKFFVKTEGISTLHFDYTELDTIVSDSLWQIAHDAVDGRFKYPLVNDVAVIDVTAQPTDVIKPSPIEINATVENQGDFTETFDVTAYYGSNPITTWTDVSLEPEANTTLTYIWDTTFVSVGVHTISAEATQVTGETDTADNEYINGIVTISNPPEAPTANFTYSPKKPLVLETITFNASASTPGTGHIESLTWNYSDGTVETFIKDINLTTITTHAYTQTGTYKVRLTVRNNESLTDSVEATIKVIQYPVALFSYLPEEPIIEETITFNASTSHDNFDDGQIVSYEWDFTYDGITFNTEATGEIATHSFPSIGTYTVALKVTDNDGLTDIATDDVTVLLHNVAVTSLTASKTDAEIGEIISITATVQNKGNFTETFQVTFYYNENTIETKNINGLAPSDTQTTTANWNTTGIAEGEYTIKATASTVEGERESHTPDNTKVDGTITLTPQEQPTPPPPFPSDLLIYAAAAAAIIILAIVAIYLLRRRKTP